ncbi:MAG TPA: hypothetical protein VEJ63_24590 [Planctomycetota bacterium]|nr:hypothetical protein [Planctomycetota bacterium]
MIDRVVLIILVCVAAAVSSAEAEKQPAADEKPKNGEAKPAKDPTALSPRMKQALTTEKRGEVVKEVELPKVPEISLKGLVKAGESGATAIIEIKDAGSQLVRAGSDISITASDGSTLALKVKKVTQDSVEIEVPALKQTLIVR